MKIQWVSNFAKIGVLPSVAILTFPSAVYAHSVSGDRASDLWHGIAHPFLGIDHVCSAIAIGLWASQRGNKAIWQFAFGFVGSVAIGIGLGRAGLALPFVEAGIATSVLFLGMLLLTARRFSTIVGVGLVMSFGLLHGHAHGTELVASQSPIGWSVGAIMSMSALFVCGVAAGLGARRWDGKAFCRVAGGTFAAIGVLMLAT